MAKILESAKRWAARHVIILTGQDGSGQVVKEADDEINALIHAWRGLGVRVSFLDWEDESAEHRCCEAMAVLSLLAWSYCKNPFKFKDFLKRIFRWRRPTASRPACDALDCAQGIFVGS